MFTLIQSPVRRVIVPIRSPSTSCLPKNSSSVPGGFSPSVRTVSRKMRPFSLMLRTRIASSAGILSGSMKNTSMNRARSRSACSEMRAKESTRFAVRERGKGHLPKRASALSSMPTIRMSGEMRGFCWTRETPSWILLRVKVFFIRKLKSRVFSSRLRTSVVP